MPTPRAPGFAMPTAAAAAAPRSKPFWTHPLFAMVVGLLFITVKNHLGSQVYDWYMPSPAPDTATTGDEPAASQFIEVHFTAPASVAESLGARLVEAGLVACAQVSEVRSIYRWDGELRSEREDLVVAKTLRSHFAAVEAELRDRHPYNVPQITAVPIVASSAEYAGWMGETLAP